MSAEVIHFRAGRHRPPLQITVFTQSLAPSEVDPGQQFVLEGPVGLLPYFNGRAPTFGLVTIRLLCHALHTVLLSKAVRDLCSDLVASFQINPRHDYSRDLRHADIKIQVVFRAGNKARTISERGRNAKGRKAKGMTGLLGHLGTEDD